MADASGDEFTLDASYVYFYSNLGGIAKCAHGATCGATPTLVTNSGYVADMKNDGTFIYWISSVGTVWKVAK